MTEKHTPEKLFLSEFYSDCLTITDKDGFEVVEVPRTAILQAYREKLGVEHWSYDTNASRELSDDEQRDFARRIVACVNACAGIPTERLELLKVPLMKHLFGCDEHAADQVKIIDQFTKQRDDLLSKMIEIQQVACSGSPELAVANEAIAAVKDKK